jgi:DNA-directed RNA polymerase specialized sigma24 family protein
VTAGRRGPAVEPPAPTGVAEVTWLQPYPDALAAHLADAEPGPEAQYEAREAISLALITALQLLPARQRAVLILRDVPGFRARAVAEMMNTTEESVTSTLKRARAATAGFGGREPSPEQERRPHSLVEST